MTAAPTQAVILSVVLATRDRLPLLREALRALDGQTLVNFETLVIDDGSTDGTSAFLDEWAAAAPDRRRKLSGPGRGPAAARNLGLRAARGEIIAMTDDDCLPEPDWLRELAAALDDPAVAGAGGRTLPLAPENLFSRFQDWQSMARPHEDDSGITFLITNNAAFRRTALTRVGGFDEEFPIPSGEDVDLSRRLRAEGFRLAYAPGARIRHHNITDWGGFFRVAYKTGQGELLLNRRGSASHKLLRTGWWGRRLLLVLLVPFHARRLRRGGISGDALPFAFLSALDQSVRWFGVLSQWRHIVRSE